MLVGSSRTRGREHTRENDEGYAVRARLRKNGKGTTVLPFGDTAAFGGTNPSWNRFRPPVSRHWAEIVARLDGRVVLRSSEPTVSERPRKMLRLEKVNKSHKSGSNSLHVLRDVDLEIDGGDFVSIMGSSGSGKSTLLNLIGILDRYDSGTYHLDEHLVLDLNDREAARYRNQFIGFVFQSFNLLSFKTALENVALPLYYRGVARRLRNQRALEYLERVGLAERAHHLPSQLSGGECQRVAVARALVTQPSLLLADEPTGALDTERSYQLMDLFQKLNQDGLTIVVVTHEHDIAERTRRTIVLRDGRIVGSAS